MKKLEPKHWMMIPIIFSVGFILGAKTLESKWIGYVVFGELAPRSSHPGILMTPPNPFMSTVDSDIVIGLREDGVVVWKERERK